MPLLHNSPRRLSFLISAIFLTFPTGGATGLEADSPPVSNLGANGIAEWLKQKYPACQSVSNADKLRTEVLDLINRERQAAGLHPLRRNALLEAQAEAYTCEMIQFNFFGHDNPVNSSNLKSRNADFGYSYLSIGENLANGYRTSQALVKGWMNSPGHRENILNPKFEEAGIGIGSDGDDMYWVLEFGQPAKKVRQD